MIYKAPPSIKNQGSSREQCEIERSHVQVNDAVKLNERVEAINSGTTRRTYTFSEGSLKD